MTVPTADRWLRRDRPVRPAVLPDDHFYLDRQAAAVTAGLRAITGAA